MTTTHYSGSTYLQNVNYQYNIRGWLTDINNVDNLSISPDPVDLFAFRINYNNSIQYDVNGMVAPLYNGNIAETTWRTASDNIRRRYGYTYDYLNRLRDAWYQVPGTTIPVSNAYNEHLTYDSNGNIMTLFRNGEVDDPDNVQEIDDLVYEYYNDNNSNRLKNVTDATTHSAGFNDGNTGSSADFEYDLYGNLIIDRNKGITEITYNHLNLPKKITFDNNEFDGTIEYLYDANGTKLKKIVTDNTTNPLTVNTTHYIDGFQYNGSKMDFFPTAEGYVKVTHSSGGGIGGGAITYNYVFNYTDHLGNIRLRYAINPVNQWLEILEEDHYYPFGLKHQGYNAENYVFASLGEGPVELIPTNPNVLETYKYKYNGKEWQDEMDLNYYDFGARNYDPALGRWMNIDPLAEVQYEYSLYHYTYNNPVLYNDPTGMIGENSNNSITTWVYDKENDRWHWIDDGYDFVFEVSPEEYDEIVENDCIEGTSAYNRWYWKAVAYEMKKPNSDHWIDSFLQWFMYDGVGDAIGYSADKQYATATLAIFLSKLKAGKKGYELVKKLTKYGKNGKMPTPDLNPEQFKPGNKPGEWIHKKTGSIFSKSKTSHGNPGNTGDQWKAWPKGTKDFGPNSKTTGTRVTIDYDGNVIGH